jgi:hypothetical protein
MNSTHLKTRILANFPYMKAHKEGRDILIVFSEDVGSAMRKAFEHDADADGIHIALTANIVQFVRIEIFHWKISFTGTFERQCQE